MKKYRLAVNLHDQAMEDADKAEALCLAYWMLLTSLGASPQTRYGHVQALLAGHRSTLARSLQRRTA